MNPESPSPKVFTALLSGNVKQLTECSEQELRPFLPSLARMVLSPSSVSMATQWDGKRKVIHMLISGMTDVNALREYLTLNYKELRQDAKREQQLLKKLSSGESRAPSQSILASSLQYGLAVEFERSDYLRRFRLFLSEILRVVAQLEHSDSFKVIQSDLFECEVHFEEVGDILCLAAAELPELLSVVQLSEALLCLERGPELLAKMVANMPDTFHQVVTHLVLNGETLDEVSLAGRCRANVIKALCLMHPSQAAYVQSLAVENCKHPTLALWLALQAEKAEDLVLHSTGVVTLLRDIIITGGSQKKAWFSQYLKCMQQKYRKHRLSAVTLLRSFLMRKLCTFLKKPTPSSAPLDSTPSEVMSQQSSDESMDEDGETAKPEDGTDTKNSNNSNEENEESKEPFLDTIEDLVDQMEIVISDHEEEGGAQKEGMATKSESAEKPADEGPPTDPKSPPTDPKSRKREERKRRRRSTIETIEMRPISLDYQLSDDDIIELMELLQVCCALKTQTMMYLKEEEAGAILSLIVSTCPPFSPAGVRFIETTLCVLLACPFLISVDECETPVVSWFKWLLDKLPEFDRACDGQCSYGELLLLMAIHLREGHQDQIKELITSTLCMTVSGPLKSGHFMILRKLFLSVFTEDVVCAHAVSVPPTPNLHGNMIGYLPIHCVHQLVKTRTFRKHGIPIKDWIYQQLLTLSEPLHPILAPLLQEFVNSVLLSPLLPRAANGPTYGNKPAVSETFHQPFTTEEVMSVYKGGGLKDGDITTQLVMFYYFILYQDTYHSNMTALLIHSQNSTSPVPSAYGRFVSGQILVKYLLTYAQTHQSLYSGIYPSLLKLTAIHFPQLCLVCEILEEKKTADNFKPTVAIAEEKVNPESAREILGKLQSHPTQALLLLSHLTTVPVSTLTAFTGVLLSTLPALMDSTVPRRIQDIYVTLWITLNALCPKQMLVQTVNAFRPPDMMHLRPYAYQTIAEDPLILLHCDKRVFRCPPLFDILLRMIAVSNAYSCLFLRDHALTQHCVTTAEGKLSSAETQVLKAQRDEQCNALIMAQESAIVQLLLEKCLPGEGDEEEEACFGPQMQVLQEIQCLLCSYLHHTFIEQPSLIKLVHFQGYPTQLLPMMVSGVPSLHICVDFIPELLAQPQIEKQQFAIQLAAHVINQYPLPEVLPIAENIFKQLLILTNEIPDHLRETYFLPLLPSIILLCQTFPPLCSEATKFLVGLSRTCSVQTGAAEGVWSGDFPSNKPCGLAAAMKRTFDELIKCAVVKA